jgi:hypothetical protein
MTLDSFPSIAASHCGHGGRVSGTVELESQEVTPEDIRILGGWDPKAQDRVIAGYVTGKTTEKPMTLDSFPDSFPATTVDKTRQIKKTNS